MLGRVFAGAASTKSVIEGVCTALASDVDSAAGAKESSAGALDVSSLVAAAATPAVESVSRLGANEVPPVAVESLLPGAVAVALSCVVDRAEPNTIPPGVGQVIVGDPGSTLISTLAVATA